MTAMAERNYLRTVPAERLPPPAARRRHDRLVAG